MWIFLLQKCYSKLKIMQNYSCEYCDKIDEDSRNFTIDDNSFIVQILSKYKINHFVGKINKYIYNISIWMWNPFLKKKRDLSQANLFTPKMWTRLKNCQNWPCMNGTCQTATVFVNQKSSLHRLIRLKRLNLNIHGLLNLKKPTGC